MFIGCAAKLVPEKKKSRAGPLARRAPDPVYCFRSLVHCSITIWIFAAHDLYRIDLYRLPGSAVNRQDRLFQIMPLSEVPKNAEDRFNFHSDIRTCNRVAQRIK